MEARFRTFPHPGPADGWPDHGNVGNADCSRESLGGVFHKCTTGSPQQWMVVCLVGNPVQEISSPISGTTYCLERTLRENLFPSTVPGSGAPAAGECIYAAGRGRSPPAPRITDRAQGAVNAAAVAGSGWQ